MKSHRQFGVISAAQKEIPPAGNACLYGLGPRTEMELTELWLTSKVLKIMLPAAFSPAANMARAREGPAEARSDRAFRAAADQEDIGRIFKRRQSRGRSRCKSRACREHRTIADVLFLRHS